MTGITELPIDAISVGERFRKEMGDLQALADEIKKDGLLHPIVVNMEHRLICGERRLEAVKLLEWKTVPVHIIDIENILRGEFAENEFRKEFTPSERLAILNALKVERGNHQGERNDLKELPDNHREVPLAKQVGFGSDFTARQAQTVVENGTPALLDAMDRGEISISAAAKVAALPAEEQNRLVEEGAKAIRAAATAKRESKLLKAIKNDPVLKDRKQFDENELLREKLRNAVVINPKDWPATAKAIFDAIGVEGMKKCIPEFIKLGQKKNEKATEKTAAPPETKTAAAKKPAKNPAPAAETKNAKTPAPKKKTAQKATGDKPVDPEVEAGFEEFVGGGLVV
jgi:ParB-like chromosome segregation protein Spo0J